MGDSYYACVSRCSASDEIGLPEPVLVSCSACGADEGEFCYFPENEGK